ncbi:hypothetical protein [Bacillus niameyensis]|uniref:hypothetical protein n=1 Tax=Bacillus niameyensis TaxID=1522308 RepID=UPI000ABFADBC|nr:hypothetical protein [Bacillus niameyensis]
MKREGKKKTLVDPVKMLIRANYNNLEPGDSLDKHRAIETTNIDLAEEEINQQNENL